MPIDVFMLMFTFLYAWGSACDVSELHLSYTLQESFTAIKDLSPLLFFPTEV